MLHVYCYVSQKGVRVLIIHADDLMKKSYLKSLKEATLQLNIHKKESKVIKVIKVIKKCQTFLMCQVPICKTDGFRLPANYSIRQKLSSEKLPLQ